MLDQQLIRVIEALCDDVGTPLAQTVKSYVRNEKWLELQKLKVSPASYRDGESYFWDACVVDLLRKAQIDTPHDKRSVAVKTFWKCENQNYETNARLSRFLPESLLIEDVQEDSILSFIEDWRKELDRLLRALPMTLSARFGKGATYADRGKLTTIPDKMSVLPLLTADAWWIKIFWSDTAWCRALMASRPSFSEPAVVRGNRFTSVPKTGLTDRGICIEPSLNISYQLDVGRILKTRLKRIGIDLLEGQHTHRVLAAAGSLAGHLATIDMSNASDTLCRVLPKLVLPRAWFELLDSLRSKFTEIDGKWVRLEKFSSMGNGFTFELETAVFATLARTIVRKNGGDPDSVRCYGDDLIVPVEHSKDVLSALAFFGFTPNEGKTFVEGPFRESCGGDFWLGTPVRAHFIQELPDEPQKWIALANGLRRMAYGDARNEHRWPRIRRAWLRCLDAIPDHIRRLRGPVHLGDLVIHDKMPHWEVRYSWCKGADPAQGFEGFYCPANLNGGFYQPYLRVYEPVPEVLQWDNWVPEVQLAAALAGLPGKGVTPRGGVSGFRIGRSTLLRSDWLPSNRVSDSSLDDGS
jgi:hypothetical protein